MTDDYRIQELERRLAANQIKIDEVPVLIEKIDGMKDAIAELRDETKSTRRTLIGFCFSIALACIVGLIGILQVIPH